MRATPGVGRRQTPLALGRPVCVERGRGGRNTLPSHALTRVHTLPDAIACSHAAAPATSAGGDPSGSACTRTRPLPQPQPSPRPPWPNPRWQLCKRTDCPLRLLLCLATFGRICPCIPYKMPREPWYCYTLPPQANGVEVNIQGPQ